MGRTSSLQCDTRSCHGRYRLIPQLPTRRRAMQRTPGQERRRLPAPGNCQCCLGTRRPSGVCLAQRSAHRHIFIDRYFIRIERGERGGGGGKLVYQHTLNLSRQGNGKLQSFMDAFSCVGRQAYPPPPEHIVHLHCCRSAMK
jgi:hypothetical protein